MTKLPQYQNERIREILYTLLVESSTGQDPSVELDQPIADPSTPYGRNPFAVLKASTVATNNKPVFPNSFTNLPNVSPPFLPPLDPSEKDTKYTLVLDLDETLIHNIEVSQEGLFLVRPGCIQFIEQVAQYYEVVIFTAAL